PVSLSHALGHLRAKHLVERVDVGLRVPGWPFERHRQRTLRMVVEETVRLFFVPGVHEDLVRLFIEERTSLIEEVLRDPWSLLHRVDKHRELVLMLRA